jgi:predicted S18 family serine protease
MRYLLALMLLLSLSFAECSGQISSFVPAVVGDSGGLVNVTISLAPGNGTTFVSVYPRTGLTTQDSIEEAVAYASRLSGKDGCDVLVDFSGKPSASYIEGPSAGTALTMLTYALLEGEGIRNDTIITGTIDARGDVGPVGGLYEKARGAASIGAKYFITPVENFYEMLLLRNMESQYGLKVLQARNVEEVIGFMTGNESISQDNLSVKDRPILSLPAYDSSGISSFGPVAEKMVMLENDTLYSVSDGENDTAGVRDFFGNEVVRQQDLIGSGYLFSAANEAFLNYIDLSTIKVILSGNADLPRKKGEAGICLSQIKRPALTDSNFEWVVGADLRQAWAYDRIQTVNITGGMLQDEKYVAYNELMYADAWCWVGKELVSAAPPGGTPIDETAWKGLAESYLSAAEALNTQDPDGQDRLGIAQDSYDTGRYGAAIYDSVFVIENERANAGTPPDENVSAMMAANRTSLWGKVYQSHAAYLYEQNLTDGAFRSAAFAEGLDEATAKMEALFREPAAAPQQPQEVQPQPDSLLLALASAISIFLLVIVAILITRRIHGDDREGAGKAYRAQQKKGRTRIPQERDGL